ncbi:rhomboid-like protein [Streptosporangium saharense]|uniref:rhomboid-like protein n=1 Tax=Streptosporangium saharense TaxID=1706840 RepID=UPI0036C18F5D
MITGVLVLVLGWYGLRGLARGWERAAHLVGLLSPYTRRLHAWVLVAPATFAYVAVFTSSTLLQKTGPPGLVRLLTTTQSTNLAHLGTRPLVVLADSALWVADKGSGLLFYIAVFATVVAWAEQRYGTPRIVVIALCGHVFGSLLTAFVEWHAIRAGRAPARLAYATDVGVSYVMVAGCAAAVVLMRGRWRVAGAVALGAGIVLPVFVTHTIWDLGHLLATLCGLTAALFALRLAPPRVPPSLEPCLPGRTGT